MQAVKAISIVLAVGAVLTGSASAQQQGSVPRVRGYLVAGGGASIEPNTTPSLFFEIGESVHRDFQIYAGFSFYDDLISQSARDQLDNVAADLTLATGELWAFSGRDRGRSFSAGVRYLLPSAGSVRPYVAAGFGALNLRREIRERSRGNMTDAFLSEFGGGDGVIDVAQTNTTKPMGELGAGAAIVVRRAYIDIGYRWRKAFHTIDQPFNVMNVSVAAGLRF